MTEADWTAWKVRFKRITKFELLNAAQHKTGVGPSLVTRTRKRGPKPVPEMMAIEIIRVIELSKWESKILSELYDFLFVGEFKKWLQNSYEPIQETRAKSSLPIRLPAVNRRSPDWASRLKEDLLRSLTGQIKFKGRLRARQSRGDTDDSIDMIIFPREVLLDEIRQHGCEILYEELPDVTRQSP
jgi:hypothetical protein